MIIVYTDGGSLGNPGPAGHGVGIEHEDGTLIDELEHPDTQTLHGEARRRVARVGTVRLDHVRREKNARADDLADRAMDAATGRAGE